MDAETEAVIARYGAAGHDGQTAVLILLQYPEPAKAQAAYANFRTEYMPESGDGYLLSNDQHWTACALQGNRVIVVADSPDRRTAEDLIGKIVDPQRPAAGEGE